MQQKLQNFAKMCKITTKLFKNLQNCAKNCVQNRKISTVGQIKPDGVSSVSIFFHLCQTLVQLARAGIPIVLLASTNPRRIILPKSHRTPLTRYPPPHDGPSLTPYHPSTPDPPHPVWPPERCPDLSGGWPGWT